ncbi:MAG TPA: protein kinase [Xanthomonadaceae bacterium]
MAAVSFPRIPGYRFQKRLGEGGMAAVYLATQESLDRPVAIKVMEREGLQDEVSKQRFENEARTIAKLTHPCIVNIYEVGRTADGRMYYIMPFLANGDLSQRDLRHQEERIIRVLRALLSALDYAHARGIVHRDVKLANVLYDVADRPLLTDFGIALTKRDTSRITSAGLAVGSSGYMAPEQARGGDVDGRADLYSLGVLAYELLTGRLPFRAPDALALALMHAQNPVPRLPPEKRHWQAFIDKAMAKAPEQRYRDAQQMMDALNRIESGSGGSITRHPGTIALFGCLLVAFGLYSARDRLPWPSPDPVSVRSDAGATTPATAPASTPAPVRHPATGLAHVTISPTTPRAGDAGSAPVTQSPATNVLAPAVATASPATATAASLSPEAAVFGEARDAIAHGNITTPADDNAIVLTQMAWKLSPSSADARSLASDTLKALADQQAQAIAQHHDARVLDFQQKALQLADATIGRDAPGARTVHATLTSAIDKRVLAESTANDNAALKRTETLARQIDLADAYGRSLAAAKQKASADAAAAAAAAAAATVDPAFVLLPPPSPRTAPSAIARGEVTRHEYAQFVNATRRPATTCKGTGAEAAGVRRTWSDPGFPVTSEQPVVCVSWSDASAYTAWLGTQKGQHYRLASAADWQAASAKGQNLAGAHAEWLQNRALVGRGGGEAAARDAAQGFDDVGFRVVRVLDTHR